MLDSQKAKILMIEDDTTHRLMYSLQFKQSGFESFTAVATGREGLNSIKKNRPDLILLDIGLADMDGIEVLKQIKADPTISSIPVIMLSNMREKDKGEQAQQLGAADYLLKAQYLPQEIVEKVEQFLTSDRK